MKKRNFYIEVLNDGFILSEDGKRKAVESENKVQDILNFALSQLISKLGASDVSTMQITISVTENPPTSADK